jgi:AcrR family transcriptional regulator
MFVNGPAASRAVYPDEKTMVRRTRDEALATREALLDAAERVFCASGVTRATLGDVASAAGVTRGAVYWHFRDKGETVRRDVQPCDAADAEPPRTGGGW